MRGKVVCRSEGEENGACGQRRADADTVVDSGEACLGVGLPIEDHPLLVSGDEDSTIEKDVHVGEMVAVECVNDELVGDLETVEAWRND